MSRVWLFLSVPWVCLQFVIVILTIFGCHSCEQRWLWRACTFAWSSLSLRHSSKFSCGDSNDDWMPCCASNEGSGESAHLHRLTLAFVTVQNLLCCLKWRLVCYSRQQRILWWVCTFAQAVTGQCNTYQDLLCSRSLVLKISCAQDLLCSRSLVLAAKALESLHVCTGSPGPSSQYQNIEMAIFVTFMWPANDVVSLHQKPQDFCATISALNQCFKKCSQCVVIKFLNKTFASIPRKKSSNRFFWMLFHGTMTTAALWQADFPQFRQ